MKRRTLLTAALPVGGVATAGLFAELGLDIYTARTRTINPFRHNPIIEAQVTEGVFFPDPVIGHRLAPPFADVFGHKYDVEWSTSARQSDEEFPSSFVGRKKIISLEDAVEEIGLSRKISMLHIGDSSTSGWDSDVVTRNRNKRLQGENDFENPLFQYQTYADNLAFSLTSINAGTPGYSSLQGTRHLKKLLGEFSNHKVSLDYVTIYFGNNDSVSNGNVQDQFVVPGVNDFKLEGLSKMLLSSFLTIPRVSAQDYEANLHSMIDQVKEYGAKPLLIVPIIPKNWHPGLRASGRLSELENNRKNNYSKSISDLDEAI